MIQSSFLIDEIADKFGLNATDDDFTAKLEEYANTTGIELPRLREFYGKSEQRTRLNFQMTEEKVVAFLLEKAIVDEVEAKSLADNQPELS
jgi:trigger factor